MVGECRLYSAFLEKKVSEPNFCLMSLVLVCCVNLFDCIELFWCEMKSLPYFAESTTTKLFPFEVSLNKWFVFELVFSKVGFFVTVMSRNHVILTCLWFYSMMFIFFTNRKVLIIVLILMCFISEPGFDIWVLFFVGKEFERVLHSLNWHCI